MFSSFGDVERFADPIVDFDVPTGITVHVPDDVEEAPVNSIAGKFEQKGLAANQVKGLPKINEDSVHLLFRFFVLLHDSKKGEDVVIALAAFLETGLIWGIREVGITVGDKPVQQHRR